MKLKKPKKMTHGGAREGAGRPATGRVVTETKYVRCSPEVAVTLDEHVATLNAARAAKGDSPLSFARWAREALLAAAGRKDLV